MSSSPSTIRVAIIGGGLAGATILRGLLRYAHIAVDMYEPRPAFRDEGPGLDFTTKMQSVLTAIDPELGQCLDRAGAVLTTAEVRTAAGPYAGRDISINGFRGMCKKTVSRQALLTEILDGIPPRMMHPNTRIASVTEAPSGQGMLLVLADGTQMVYDIVIGADGAHGFTRQLVLGTDEFLVKPHATGFWSVPVKVPLMRAQHAMGTHYLDPMNPRQICWIGDGTGMLHNLLDNGNEVQIVVCGKTEEVGEDLLSGSSWAKIFTPDEFQELFAGIQIPVCQAMIDLVLSVYTVQVAAICQLEHPPTPTYVTKNVCLVGDSAQSMPQFQGASISIAIEEALILTSLLGRLPSREAIPAALQAYDQICRPRAERAARSVIEAGSILTGCAPGVGLDANMIEQQMQNKFDFLLEDDHENHRATAHMIMDQLLGAEVTWS